MAKSRSNRLLIRVSNRRSFQSVPTFLAWVAAAGEVGGVHLVAVAAAASMAVEVVTAALPIRHADMVHHHQVTEGIPRLHTVAGRRMLLDVLQGPC